MAKQSMPSMVKHSSALTDHRRTAFGADRSEASNEEVLVNFLDVQDVLVAAANIVVDHQTS